MESFCHYPMTRFFDVVGWFRTRSLNQRYPASAGFSTTVELNSHLITAPFIGLHLTGHLTKDGQMFLVSYAQERGQPFPHLKCAIQSFQQAIHYVWMLAVFRNQNILGYVGMMRDLIHLDFNIDLLTYSISIHEHVLLPPCRCWIGQEMFKANGEMTTDSDEDGNAREHQKGDNCYRLNYIIVYTLHYNII